MRSQGAWPRVGTRAERPPGVAPAPATSDLGPGSALPPAATRAETIAAAESVLHWVDRTFHVVGLLVRSAVYLLLFHLADKVDCGPALCGGVLLGDVTSFVALTLWHWRGELVAFLAALALFTLLFLVFGHRFDVPQEPAQRAILGLAAFGTVSGRLGRDLLDRVSGRNDGLW